MEKIPVFAPLLFGTEWEFIKKALDERNISGTSPVVDQFEAALSKYFECRHAVAVSNGTTALHVATQALDLKPGDEVIMPDFTIISNPLAVTLCGAKPVFVDVNEKDWCIDVSKIAAAITPRTRGIMAVHMYGNACDMDALTELCRRHGLWLIEDAAQAQDGKWNNVRLGTIGDVGTFSFYSNKLITTGEGGAVITGKSELSERMKRIRNLGFDADPAKRFIHSELASNYRMSSLQAAMGLGQVARIQELVEKRNQVRNYYRDAFGTPKGFRVAIPDARCSPSFWTCSVVLDDDTRITVPDVQRLLAEKGIETRRFFFPLHLQPALAGLHDQMEQSFPISEKLFQKGLYLPSSSLLTWEQVQTIAYHFEQFLI